VSSGARDVDPGRLAQWCVRHLGSPPADEIFRSGYLSAVTGLRLADDRAVVLKVRPGSPRVAACVDVQRRLFQSGHPCPEPLTGAAPFGDAPGRRFSEDELQRSWAAGVWTRVYDAKFAETASTRRGRPAPRTRPRRPEARAAYCGS
jgi:hypothetical protein